jgi:UTP:GlnB (protein PII) uridylyltransferase
LTSLRDPLEERNRREILEASRAFASHTTAILREHFSDAPVPIYLTGSFALERPCPFSDLDLIFVVDSGDDPRSFESWVEAAVYPLYTHFPKVAHAFWSENLAEKLAEEDFRVYVSVKEGRALLGGKALPWLARMPFPEQRLTENMRARWDRWNRSPCHVQLNTKESPGALLDHLDIARVGGGKGGEGAEHFLCLRAFTQATHGKNVDTVTTAILKQCAPESVTRLFTSAVAAFMWWRGRFGQDAPSPPISSLSQWGEIAQGEDKKLLNAYLSGSFEKLFPVMHRQLFRLSDSPSHVYTVGWHSLECVRAIKELVARLVVPEPPLLENMLELIDRTDILFISGFLHDIGKGEGGDHSEWGAAWVREHLRSELGRDTELVAWLVENHLELHGRSMKEDLFDQSTVSELARWIESPRRLAYLYLLTIADLMSTNRKLWTQWRAQILGTTVSQIWNALGRPRERHDTAEESAVQDMPSEYRLTRSKQGVSADRELLNELKNGGGLAVSVEFDTRLGFTLVGIALQHDCFGFLSKITEVLFEQRLGVWRLRTYPRPEGILDLIWVYPYEGAELRLTPARMKRLTERLRKELAFCLLPREKSRPGRLKELKERLEIASGAPVSVTESGGAQWDILVQCADRTGLLKDLVGAITTSGYNIISANIGTTADQAIDRFRVTTSVA